MIKNIIFDMGGVLIDWAPSHLIESLKVPKEDQGILIRELFKEVEWLALDAGIMDDDEVFEAVSKRVPERLHEPLKFLISKWWSIPFNYKKGMGELVRELYDNGYKLYLLSNASIYQKDYVHRLPGHECFTGRVTSAEIKMMKPQKEIYQYICDKYDLKPEECYFVDDYNGNVYFARLFGFKSNVFFDVDRLRKQMIMEGIDVKEQ